MTTRLFNFAGGKVGPWRVVKMEAIVGKPLPDVARLNVITGPLASMPQGAKWLLRGITSNERYVTRQEKEQLVAKQPSLGRHEAICAALIPIRKSASWWDLAQDERRAIFEERSHHISLSMKYLPAIARRLHHSRDLGEPFDFLTWFEFAPEHAPLFEELVDKLRSTEEWKYVEREVDIRLSR